MINPSNNVGLMDLPGKGSSPLIFSVHKKHENQQHNCNQYTDCKVPICKQLYINKLSELTYFKERVDKKKGHAAMLQYMW